jgi:hypothetical protein
LQKLEAERNKKPAYKNKHIQQYFSPLNFPDKMIKNLKKEKVKTTPIEHPVLKM